VKDILVEPERHPVWKQLGESDALRRQKYRQIINNEKEAASEEPDFKDLKKGIAGDILDNPLKRIAVRGGNEHTLVNAEPGMLPRAHLFDSLMGNQPLVEEQFEHLVLPQLQERLNRESRQGNERPVWREYPIARNRVDVRMPPMREFPESLDIRHHSGNHVIPSENRLIHLPDQFIGEFQEMSEEFAVEAEVNPQPFRNGEDELPMRDFRKDLLADMHGKLKDAFLVAGRTEASDFAGEGDEQVVPAIVTADSGKALTQVAALRARLKITWAFDGKYRRLYFRRKP
jgi:hypothetical protein